MNPSNLGTPASAKKAQATRKLISFKLQSPQDPSRSLNFAVAIEQVQRILSQTAVVRSGINPVGLVADQNITMIDLHQLIFGSGLEVSSYLVVLKSPSQGLFGLPVAQSPSLVDLNPDNLKPLPTAYRAMDTLGIASHVAKADTDDGQQTVFMLDLDRLVSHLMKG
jgi:chemotaxis signal transduction protein